MKCLFALQRRARAPWANSSGRTQQRCLEKLWKTSLGPQAWLENHRFPLIFNCLPTKVVKIQSMGTRVTLRGSPRILGDPQDSRGSCGSPGDLGDPQGSAAVPWDLQDHQGSPRIPRDPPGDLRAILATQAQPLLTCRNTSTEIAGTVAR